MSPIATLIQFFFDFQARQQTERLRIAGIRAAEKGRRMAIAGAFFTIAAAFFFAGLIVGVIELGLQMDRGDGVGFTGLMFSATLLIVFGILCCFTGWLAGRDGTPVTTVIEEEVVLTAEGGPASEVEASCATF